MLLEQEKAQRRLLCLYLYAHGLEVCITCKNILSFWAEEWSEKSVSWCRDSSLCCASFRMTGVYKAAYFYHKVH